MLACFAAAGVKKAFELYKGSNVRSSEVIMEIDSIKNNMNSKRTVFDMSSHKLNITSEWLLGFVEGDRSFSVSVRGLILIFSIGQKGNLVLMKTIKSFLVNLAKVKGLKDEAGFVYITGSEPYYVLSIKKNNLGCSSSCCCEACQLGRKEGTKKALIPFFDSMSWHSKKELDYKDWKTIFNIKELGLHFY